MPRKRIRQFTEREAKQYAAEQGRSIEILTAKPMTYAAARKRLPEDGTGFLIFDQDTGRLLAAVLVDAPLNTNSQVQKLVGSWDGCEAQGWDGPGWYFWDETQAYCHGPFKTEWEAVAELERYCREELGV